MNYDSFTPEVCKELDYYVYELIDPRNGRIFYVGKGKDNRVFDHMSDAQKLANEAEQVPADKRTEDRVSLKVATIQAIHDEGLKVIPIIVRHGLDEKTAYTVEATLIDVTPGLANEIGGHDSKTFGAMNAKQIIDKYTAEEITEFTDKCLIIKIRQATIDEGGSVYEAVRRAWVLKKEHADKADCILAVSEGFVVGVFVTEGGWQKCEDSDRYYFTGREASEEIKAKYFHRRIPQRYRNRAAASPIRYTF